VASLTFDLFCELNATDEQLDFPIVYASGRSGYATLDLDEPATDMKPLLETIVRRVLPPVADFDQPFQMLVTMLDYDSYVGRIANGRIAHGMIRTGEPVALIKRDGEIVRSRVTRLLRYQGLRRIEVREALAGDIVSIAGVEDVHVGETIASSERPEALPLIKIDEPTISMFFSHNTSPLSGKDGGRFLTSRHIRERLEHEAMINVGIRVEDADGGERFKVSGRGELHLAILIETMRREGYEMEVSRPRVILKETDAGLLEPVEEVVVEVDPGYEGAVIDALGRRKAEMRSMITSAVGTIRMEFIVATRGLIGFRTEFLTMTRGTGVMYQNFHEYQAYKGDMPRRSHGVQVALHPGHAVAYALWSLEERGEIFIRPGDPVYEGMIIGANNKGSDLVVNAIKEKKLTNMRASGADDAIQLTPPREMTLEFALEFIGDDELVEITPKSIRLRKKILDDQERKVASKRPAAV
jgi:GTP-binding protein